MPTLGAPRPVTPLGILAERLDALARRAADGTDVDLAAGLREAHALAAGLDPYLEQVSSPPSPALERLAEHTRTEDWSRYGGGGLPFVEQEMLSGHIEGQLLRMLVHVTQAERVLDIGMFTGYSALAMAEALPGHGRVVACEVEPQVAAFARRCFDESPDGAKIDVRVGPAAETLLDLARRGARFELVFLDADKAGYSGYLNAVLDGRLLAPHGLVCVDNTLLQGEPYLGPTSDNGRAVAAFNASVAADPRIEQVLLPVRDGVTFIRRVDGA